MRYSLFNFYTDTKKKKNIFSILLFKRKEKNEYGYIIKKSNRSARFYEKLLYQVMEGSYKTKYVNNDEKLDRTNIQELKLESKDPFDNMAQFFKHSEGFGWFTTYKEHEVNTIDDFENHFVTEVDKWEDNDISVVDKYIFGKIKENKYNMSDKLCPINESIVEYIKNIIDEDITTLIIELDNADGSVGLHNIPMNFLKNVYPTVNNLTSANNTDYRNSYVSLYEKCFQVKVHLPKTTEIETNISDIFKTVKNILNEDYIDINEVDDNIAGSLVNIINSDNIDYIKITQPNENRSTEVLKEDTDTIIEKIKTRRKTLDKRKKKYNKKVIIYEINYLKHTFEALDEDKNEYKFYVPEDFDLIVIEDKKSNNTREYIESILSSKKKFSDFEKFHVSISGEYRSQSTLNAFSIT
ncbi:hypothetical protein GJV85_12180 [Sulfurimonas aquatica]|uniref:Uncharacterized protein n=1 Tax=Sulfurimonas aquatica TaxID=2672570 RepID=A0A975GDZ6_9BACT|nr:hypothetical protein [Sulfurimonas aquatica]QSZ42834.1 hypothetical protein GJV85_12180 [Sulfurimonas aquatica]